MFTRSMVQSMIRYWEAREDEARLARQYQLRQTYRLEVLEARMKLADAV
jgi:hypothetical protein